MQTALVLSGGGSRGAYEIGVWRALGELDIPFSIVTGTSVGALNGAVIAQGSFDLAEQLWKELETSHVFDLALDEALPPRKKWFEAVRLFGKAAALEGGAGTGALQELLNHYLDEEKVRASPIDFGIVTVQLDGMKPRLVWKEEMPPGSMVDYLIASSSMFPAIRPHEIDGKKFIDGAFYDNMPIRMAIDRGARRIIAVNMDAPGIVRSEKEFKQYDIRVIRSYWDLGSILVFDPRSARHNLRLGYLDAMRSFGIFDGFAFAFRKGTVAETARREYRDFYELAGLLGLENSGRRFLGSVAYQAVEKRVFRRGIRPPNVRGFVLDGMECAGEIFGLDPGIIYTPERFRECLSEQLAQAVPPEGAQTNVTALKLLDPRLRAVLLAGMIREAAATRKKNMLLPTAAALTDEFSAALYLALAGLL